MVFIFVFGVGVSCCGNLRLGASDGSGDVRDCSCWAISGGGTGGAPILCSPGLWAVVDCGGGGGGGGGKPGAEGGKFGGGGGGGTVPEAD